MGTSVTARELACEFLRPIQIVAKVGAGVCWINDMPKPLHCRECNDLTAVIEAETARLRSDLTAANRERDELRKALEELAKEECAFVGSYDSCADAVDDGEYDGSPCPKCVAVAALARATTQEGSDAKAR